jgi:hypothetical protein
MKKLLLFSVFALCVSVMLSAQSDERSKGVTTKNGTPILPAAGDFAIGVDAAPFLKYAGGFFSDAGASAPAFKFDNEFSIYGKYFLAPNRAIRAVLTLDLSTSTTKTAVPEIGSSDNYVDNSTKDGTTAIGLSVGYELRRGYGRLQGFYGAGVGLGYKSTTTTREYGNALSSNNSGPRTKETSSGGQFGAGLGGFIGVEYFVAPKISVGAEVGLNLLFSNTPKGETITEKWDGSKAVEETVPSYSAPGKVKFGTDVDGKLFLTFHF